MAKRKPGSTRKPRVDIQKTETRSIHKLKDAGLLKEEYRLLIDEYFIGLDAVAACKKVGVKTADPRAYFYNIMKRPSAVAYLSSKMELARSRNIVSEQTLMRDLEFMRNLSPWDFLDEVETRGRMVMQLKPKEEIPREAARWIKKIKQKVSYRYKTEFAGQESIDITIEDVTTEVEFHSVLDVIDKLARMLGAYREKEEGTGDGTIPTLFLPEKAESEEQWEQMVKQAQVIKVHSDQRSGTHSSDLND